MKTKQLIITAVILFFCTLATVAQDPVTTLQHKGTTTLFYGIESFAQAVNAAVNNDTLYIQACTMNPPGLITKKLYIVGAGHFLDSSNGRTVIAGGLTIGKGADSLHIEGLYIRDDINYESGSSINYVQITRCRLNNASFNSSSATVSKNYCSFEECISNSIDFSGYGTNLLVRHCIINGRLSTINGSAIIDGNVFIQQNYNLVNVFSSLIQNNIFCGQTGYGSITGVVSNFYSNNLFTANAISFGQDSRDSNNYLGVSQVDIFVNQSGNSFDYTHDYHLKNPEKYIGTDGTQVGLYGGPIPFKEKGLPSNPQITSKSIARQTDANGNLPVNITVKAQAN